MEEIGVCHLCHTLRWIKYCSICEHWFCKGCRKKYFWRGYEAVREMVNGRRDGCCGPLKED